MSGGFFFLHTCCIFFSAYQLIHQHVQTCTLMCTYKPQFHQKWSKSTNDGCKWRTCFTTRNKSDLLTSLLSSVLRWGKMTFLPLFTVISILQRCSELYQSLQHWGERRWPSPLCTVTLILQRYSELYQSLQCWGEGRWLSPLCTVTLILQWYSELSQPSLYYFIDYFLHGQNVSLYSM